MRPLVAIVGVAIFIAVAVMASAGRGAPPPKLAASPDPVPSDWPQGQPTEPPLSGHVRLLSGFVLPLEGLEIPEAEQYLPNSPREYRAGYHEGIDFPAARGTLVLAAKAGVVVRIDREYVEWSAEDRQAAFDEAQAQGHTPEAILDRIRGRQVWIDHGQGIVTRYAHLSSVAPLVVGTTVAAREVIGAVGSSGYPEGGPHLHFEIRVGDGFYGDGLAGPQLRYALSAAFR